LAGNVSADEPESGHHDLSRIRLTYGKRMLCQVNFEHLLEEGWYLGGKLWHLRERLTALMKLNNPVNHVLLTCSWVQRISANGT
jgi:hypothetical protein